jgi:hypothetical protein
MAEVLYVCWRTLILKVFKVRLARYFHQVGYCIISISVCLGSFITFS